MSNFAQFNEYYVGRGSTATLSSSDTSDPARATERAESVHPGEIMGPRPSGKTTLAWQALESSGRATPYAATDEPGLWARWR